MGNNCSFGQMVQVCSTLHITLAHKQESGKLTVDNVYCSNGGYLDKTE